MKNCCFCGAERPAHEMNCSADGTHYWCKPASACPAVVKYLNVKPWAPAEEARA